MLRTHGPISTKCPPLATFELVHHEKRKKKHGDIIPIKVKQEHFMKVIIRCKRDEGMYVEDFNVYTIVVAKYSKNSYTHFHLFIPLLS